MDIVAHTKSDIQCTVHALIWPKQRVTVNKYSVVVSMWNNLQGFKIVLPLQSTSHVSTSFSVFVYTRDLLDQLPLMLTCFIYHFKHTVIAAQWRESIWNFLACAQVRAILLDPSCSGSGTTVQRLDHLLPSAGTGTVFYFTKINFNMLYNYCQSALHYMSCFHIIIIIIIIDVEVLCLHKNCWILWWQCGWTFWNILLMYLQEDP